MSDISSSILKDAFYFLEKKGLPPSALWQGRFGLDPSIREVDLRDPRQKVSWETYTQVCERLRELFPEEGFPEEFLDVVIGRENSWVIKLLPVTGLFMDIHRFYRLVQNYFGPSMFPCVAGEYERLSKTHLRLRLTLLGNRRDNPLFFELCGFCFGRLPTLFGLPRAEVTPIIKPGEAVYDVKVPAKIPLLQQVKSFFRVLFSSKDAYRDLAVRDEELASSHHRLARLQEQKREQETLLEQRVRERQRELEEANARLRERIEERRKAQTELQASQKRMTDLLDHIPALVSFVDREGRYRVVNQANRGVGFDPEAIKGRTLEEVMPEPGQAEWLTQFRRKVMETGEPAREERWQDGPVGWLCFDCSAGPVFDSAGNVAGVVTVSRNMTAEKRAEEELEQARKTAADNNRAKTIFLSNVSHEIRSPLSAILGYAELLENPSLSEQEKKHYLTVISRSGERLMQLIDDVLDLAKVDSGRLPIVPAPFPLKKLLQDTVLSKSETASQKNIDLLFSADPDLPEQVTGDARRIRQALRNLIQFVILKTTSSTIRVTARGEFDSTGTGRLKLLIETEAGDEGIRATDDIFIPFYEVESDSPLREDPHAVLGPSLAHKLLTAMGADVHLKPADGSKAPCFALEIPFSTETFVGARANR